jgi:hypothetical protein
VHIFVGTSVRGEDGPPQFDFVVEYKPGASNTVADELSRRSEEESGALAALSAPVVTVFDTLHGVG